jgi:hypothetical protein
MNTRRPLRRPVLPPPTTRFRGGLHPLSVMRLKPVRGETHLRLDAKHESAVGVSRDAQPIVAIADTGDDGDI